MTDDGARSRRWTIVVGVALAVALALRLAFVVVSRDYRPLFDAGDFDRHAVSIATGHGYPVSFLGSGATAFRGPVYPVTLAAAYAVTGTAGSASRWVVGLVLQALIGTVIVLVVARIGSRVWDVRAGGVAAALAAVYPPLIAWGGGLLSEPLFILLTLLAVLAALRARDDPGRLRWAALAGALAGLVALTRPNGMLLALPIALGVWVARPRLRRAALAAPAVLVAATAAVVLPWTIRNIVVMGSAVPLTTQTGFVTASVWNEQVRSDPEHPGWGRVPWLLPEFADVFSDARTLGEDGVSRELARRALAHAANHPLYVAQATALNAGRLLEFHGPALGERDLLVASVGARTDGGGNLGIASRVVSTLAIADMTAFWIVAIAAAGSAAAGALRGTPPWLWAIPGIVVLSAAPFLGDVRYRLPADPFLILAAAALATMVGRARAGRGQAEPARVAAGSGTMVDGAG